ncbi:ABC transporter permease [Oceanotoga sp. DSM 15011]|jgi:peptide/nickel transport system permease protein|uniref:Peptide/nickel transport system permease protein n=1 Tax=Oceanotoga teriensis TaxID=515440 RepID=A0AA45C4X5_9BACT|nr:MULTISPECIES: ABC transporter permease [Oceanotoga]MDN5341356.1 peptide/nickel transport system permease protein [Oceanotoga sp.]MDO7976918.1 ABC transporter permease [Oceanotoga teriensis]PWJ87417.1 peptide/nickel transport system permease protein [Oceanotoga teriensis]UYO99611.1 ABC transporter permease [Oceanotoga sp. DSM 15011]
MYWKYVIKRIIAGIIMFIILMFTYSALFNKVMEETTMGTINEQIRMEVKSLSENNPKFDASSFVKNRKEYYIKLYGLDKSYIERVFNNTWKTIRFDFGQATNITSSSGEKDVTKIVLEALPRTIVLFTLSQVIILIIALLIGLKKAQKPSGKFDRTTSVITMIVFGMPKWWVGMMFIMLFSYGLKIFPSGGMHRVPPPETSFGLFLDYLHHLALPVITYVIVGFWGVSFIVRNIVLGTLQEDYIMAARARGIGENSVLYRHTMRTAAPPIITMVVLSILASFGGSLIFEGIFSWPGMGNLYLIANQQNDIPVLMGNLAFTTGIYIIGLVILDLIYGFLDPRIKVGG